VCYLVFQLKTHHDMFTSEDEENDEQPALSVSASISMLTVITLVVACCSELLTGSLEEVADTLNVSQGFLGMIVLPIAGNACEHITAVVVAAKNKMDLALGVAIGSSIQIAIFAIPLVVLVGWATGHAFSLSFDPFVTVAMTVSVIHANFVTNDATSHWLMGVQLIATYLLIAITFLYKTG
jgi:Ca2+:H+ antiporter